MFRMTGVMRLLKDKAFLAAIRNRLINLFYNNAECFN